LKTTYYLRAKDKVKKSSEITVAIPVFNESEGIIEYIREIRRECPDWVLHFLIVDDASTDDTLEKLSKFGAQMTSNFEIHQNKVNLGHGPTVYRSIALATQSKSQYILTLDGDGQVGGVELNGFLSTADLESFDLIEGVRVNRTDPYFRKMLTYCLRLLVMAKTHSFPKDANTPLKLYSISGAHNMLSEVDYRSMTPNLRYSIVCRLSNKRIQQISVRTRDRLGESRLGVTWGGSQNFLPSKKLIKFCLKAWRQLHD